MNSKQGEDFINLFQKMNEDGEDFTIVIISFVRAPLSVINKKNLFFMFILSEKNSQ